MQGNPELSVVDQIKLWFGRISFGLIMVSCGDVMLVLWHYIPESASPGEKAGRAFLLTSLSIGLIIAIVWAGRFIELQRRAKQPIGCMAWFGFWVSIGFEFTINTGALMASLPGPDVMPRPLAVAIAIFVGLLISLTIYNTGISSNALERTRQHLIAMEEAEAERKRKQAEAEAERKRQEAAAVVLAQRRQAEEAAGELRRRQQQEEDERYQRERQRRLQEAEDRQLLASTKRRQPGAGIRVTDVTRRRQPRALPAVNPETIYEAVNVDGERRLLVGGKSTKVDDRAPEWLTMVDDGMSYQAISDSLGGAPSKQHIGKHVNLYKQWLTLDAEVEVDHAE